VLAEAIQYTLTRWSALCHLLDDGRIELDNNSVERESDLSRSSERTTSDGGAQRWVTFVP